MPCNSDAPISADTAARKSIASAENTGYGSLSGCKTPANNVTEVFVCMVVSSFIRVTATPYLRTRDAAGNGKILTEPPAGTVILSQQHAGILS